MFNPRNPASSARAPAPETARQRYGMPTSHTQPHHPDPAQVWEWLRAVDPRITYCRFLGMGALSAGMPICADARAPRLRPAGARALETPLLRLGYRIDSAGRIRRSRSPLGPRSNRELMALADWAAILHRPPSHDGCATGLAAYDLLLNYLATRRSLPGRSASAVRALAVDWRSLRLNGAAFLQELAGKSRAPFANRLRAAAHLMEDEAVVWGSFSGVARLKPPQAVACVTRARDGARRAAGLLADALVIGLHLPRSVALPLFQEPGSPLEGVALEEMVYVARAGALPLRQLAARRLAGAESPRALAALQQLLYDADADIAEVALWSLMRSAPHRAHIYIDAYRAMAARPGAVPLLRGLLHAVSRSGAAESRAFLREVAAKRGDADSRRLARLADSLCSGPMDAG